MEVTTDLDGDNSAVWLVTLCQVLQLNLNESPFYGNWGIPGPQAVLQQAAPDFYVALTQSRFAQYFAALTVAKVASLPPTYKINATLLNGANIEQYVPLPT